MVDTQQPPVDLPTREFVSPVLNSPPTFTGTPSVPKPPAPPDINIPTPPIPNISEEPQNTNMEKTVSYGTELRTMQQDMSNISTGSPISGAQIIPSAPIAPSDISTLQQSENVVPQKVSHKLRNILFIFGFLLFGIAIVLLLSSGNDATPQTIKIPRASLTRSPTQSSAPSPSSSMISRTSELANIFGTPTDTISLENSANARALFLSRVSSVPILSRQLISIGTSITGNTSPSAHEILVALVGEDPSNVAASMGNDWALLVYGQTEQFDNTGLLIANAPTSRRLALIAETKDSTALIDSFRSWENGSISSAFAAALSYNPTQAKEGFKDGTYLQQTIRYKNFPNPDRSIDYTIVSAKNGKSYLVVTGSRESMLTIIRSMVSQ